MAATALSNLLQAKRGGAVISTGSVACDNVNGNSVVNDGNVALILASTAGGTVVVQSVATGDAGNLAAPTFTITLTGAQTVLTDFFNPAIYGSTLTFTASVSTISVLPVHLT
jgi:hypothetical protein